MLLVAQARPGDPAIDPPVAPDHRRGQAAADGVGAFGPPRVRRVLRLRVRGTMRRGLGIHPGAAPRPRRPRRHGLDRARGDHPRSSGPRSTARARTRRVIRPRRGRARPDDALVSPGSPTRASRASSSAGPSARTVASSSPGRRSTAGTLHRWPWRARSGSCRAAAQRGESATSSPPSSSYAGKRSTTTGLTSPARVRSSSCSPRRRTPHSRTSSSGAASESAKAVPTSRPIRSGSRKPGQLEDSAADREHAGVAVADDEPGRRRRVVVLEQLEEEAEAAVAALGGVRREPLVPVDVDRVRSRQFGQMKTGTRRSYAGGALRPR